MLCMFIILSTFYITCYVCPLCAYLVHRFTRHFMLCIMLCMSIRRILSTLFVHSYLWFGCYIFHLPYMTFCLHITWLTFDIDILTWFSQWHLTIGLDMGNLHWWFVWVSDLSNETCVMWYKHGGYAAGTSYI